MPIRFPTGLGTEYFLLTPPNVVTCFDATSGQCSANDTVPSDQIFCAYHNSFGSLTAPTIYANIPDLSGLAGCDPFQPGIPGYGCPTTTPCPYPNGPADGVLSSVVHEHNESTTDPEPNNAWTDWQPGCSSGAVTCGGENGDKCGSDMPLNPGGTAPQYETINGDDYWLQTMWSNQDHKCTGSFTSNGTTASASFTATADPTLSDTVNFDASASTVNGSNSNVAEYVWQFNDTGGSFPQDFTVETTSSTESYTFPSPGPYNVALTVMAADGTSNGTANLTTAQANPVASFTTTPNPPIAASSATFNSATSHDPNPGGSISSYSWDFGDSTTSSTPSPTHTYATPGQYTVKLTVTDALSRKDTLTRTVTVLDAIPTASFSAPSGLAGTSLVFHGSAADSDGSIAATSWNFGDGNGASGTNVSHTYSAAGTYAVTFSATDATGQSVSVVHNVTVAASCKVPGVKGKSRSKATNTIRSAGCALGKVKTPKKKQHKALVVKKQSGLVGAIEAAGTAIALVLGYK